MWMYDYMFYTVSLIEMLANDKTTMDRQVHDNMLGGKRKFPE